MNNYNLYRLIGYLLLIVALFSSCEFEDDFNGNGNIESEHRIVGHFYELDVDGVLNVYLSQSDRPYIEVVTDENLQHIVETETINKTLYIKTDETNYEATQMDVYISVPDLTRIKLNGVTALNCLDTLELDEITIEKFNVGYIQFDAIANRLNLECAGTGNIELHGKALSTTIYNNMVGDIFAYGFKSKTMDIVHDGTGDVEVFVTDVFDVELLGVGNVYCKGYPKNYSITGDGIGRVKFVD